MQAGHQVTSVNSFQIPLRHGHTIQPIHIRGIINPKRGMEEPLQPQAPHLPNTCGSPGATEKSCLDIKLAVFLVTLAGAVILLLLYKLLQLRHRLSMARARHALEYYSFYHTATYTLKHSGPCQDPPVKNGVAPDATPQVLSVATMTSNDILPLPAPPALPLPSPPALPPPPIQPPPAVHSPPMRLSAPPVLALPLPVIYTTPPSPHSSLGACSDADVYSRIGAFRPSRLSSLSSRSTVILFEHSSL